MRWLLTYMLILMGLSVQGQEWAPFQPGQISFYETVVPLEGDTAIIRREVGAAFSRSGYTALYFHDGFLDSCTADQITVVTSTEGFDLDSLLLFPDRFIYIIRDDSLVYQHMIDVDSSFDITNWGQLSNNPDVEALQITLDSIATYSFFGFNDSVRFFSVQALKNGIPVPSEINQHNILLSKHHGFIHYLCDIPWQGRYFIPSPTPSLGKLIGITKDTMQQGFRDFEPSELVTFQLGDILKWWEKIEDFSSQDPIKIEWHRDSILSVQATDSLFQYTYYRRTKKDDGTIVNAGSHTKTIHLKSWVAALANNSIYAGQPQPGAQSGLGDRIILLGSWVRSPWGLTIKHSFGGHFVESSSCQLGQMTDIYDETGFTLGIGPSSFYSIGFSGDYEIKLVGYVKGSITHGNHWPLGKAPISVEEKFNIFPNPVIAQIHLDLPRHVLLEGTLSIQDITGRTVLQKPLNGQSTWPVSQLQPGLYLITVTTDDGRYQTKLIVQ